MPPTHPKEYFTPIWLGLMLLHLMQEPCLAPDSGQGQEQEPRVHTVISSYSAWTIWEIYRIEDDQS